MSAFFDIYSELSSNVGFRNDVAKFCTAIQRAAAAGNKPAMDHFLIKLLEKCHGNPGLLVPIFWPRYPDTKPMSFWGRPHSFGMSAFIPHGSLVVQAGRQVGKCLTSETVVVTKNYDGELREETMQDLFEESRSEVA